MKSNAGKVLLTTVAASLGWFATAQAQTAKPDLVAKVAAGELKKARASWWGFNAENLLIENTIMRDTAGTPPAAGIDFEPNHRGERLKNCVMRNCLTQNNQGDGYEFYLPNLHADSEPLSILIENCRSIGDRTAARVITANSEEEAVKATITDPTGKEVWSRDTITLMERYTADKGEGKAGGLWRISFARPAQEHFEDFKVELLGAPAFLFLDKDRYWTIE